MAIGGPTPFNAPQGRTEAQGQVLTSSRQNPYLPPGPQPTQIDQFKGVNTNTTRPGVPDEQMWWCDGFIPLSPRNLRTLYGIGAVAYTAVGTTVLFYEFANIGETPYMIVVLADGSVVGVNTTTLVATTILAAASITSPSITTVGISQWGNEYVIIVADQTDGYWLWNGTTVFTAGGIAPVVDVVSAGAGYSSAPTIFLSGGHGSGATFSVSVSSEGVIVGVSVVTPGTGYLATDSITPTLAPAPSGGSGGSINVSTLSTIASGPYVGQGCISAISIVAVGSLYVNPSITFVRIQTLVTPTATASVANGSLVSITMLSRGAYNIQVPASLATIYPTVVITDTAVAGTVSVHLMPFGIQGTAVETYQGHVWVASGATVYYSAPGEVDNFATSDGGGNFTSTDSHLKVRFTQLIAANGFLYLIGDSSVNYISGVNTSGTPPTTTFTQTDADIEVGSPYPQSVIAFGRNVLMSNSYGVHTVKGGAVNKVSEMLDGLFTSVDEFGGLQLSAAQATIFGDRVWMILLKLVNPMTGTTENKIAMWDGGEKWWFSGQEITLSYIKHQEIDSVITTYGTNGTVIHPLFQQASGSLTKVMQSRLYDAPGGFLFRKAETRFWGASQYYSTVSTNLVMSIDNEKGTMAAPYTLTGDTATGSIHIYAPQAVAQQGPLYGMTIQTSAADMAFILGILQSEVIDYRG